jgi:hypothetical protein
MSYAVAESEREASGGRCSKGGFWKQRQRKICEVDFATQAKCSSGLGFKRDNGHRFIFDVALHRGCAEVAYSTARQSARVAE